MIFPSQADWDSWGITSDAHKFFLLCWQDIFADDTFDSWQVRTSNIKTVLREIIEACEIVQKVHHYHLNLRVLLDEAKTIADDDIIVDEHFSFMKGYLHKLDNLYDSQVKNPDKFNIAPFANLTKVVLGNISSYRDHLQTCIHEVLNNPPHKFKIRLYKLSLLLGTELLSMGYSTSYCKDGINILKDSAIGAFDERFRTMIEQFNGKEVLFQCKLYITWPAEIDNTINLSERIALSNKPNGPFAGEEEKFYKQDKGAVIAEVSVMALDEHSARYKAEEELGGLFAVSGLYQKGKITGIRQPLALVRTELGEPKCVPKDNSWSGYIRDSNKPESLSEMFSLLGKIKPEEAKQILASMQYHRLALSATTDESMFVNLWIALESLIQEGGKNIIDRISTYVSASATVSYPAQTLKEFANSVKGSWQRNANKALVESMPNSSSNKIHTNDLISMFLDENESKRNRDFLSILDNHCLLLYRASDLYTNFFGSPKVLKDRLDRHKNNVMWQIRRIYRIRNLIMHTGYCPVGTRQLIQNLHTYYLLTIHGIINDLKRHPDWGVYEALDHRNYIYETLFERLEKYSDRPLLAKSLAEPWTVLDDNGGEHAWHPSRL